jgi:hypothetical protein
LAEARDVLPGPGADLQTGCSGEPELFSAAPRVVEERCLDEKPSVQTRAGERGLRLDDSALALVEAPDARVAHCWGEKASAEERAPRLDEWVPTGAEAPDARVAHCLDVRVSALEPAQPVMVLVQAESEQVSHDAEPVGSAPSEFFPVCPYDLCSFRQDARLPLHRVVHG